MTLRNTAKAPTRVKLLVTGGITEPSDEGEATAGHVSGPGNRAHRRRQDPRHRRVWQGSGECRVRCPGDHHQGREEGRWDQGLGAGERPTARSSTFVPAGPTRTWRWSTRSQRQVNVAGNAAKGSASVRMVAVIK